MSTELGWDTVSISYQPMMVTVHTVPKYKERKVLIMKRKKWLIPAAVAVVMTVLLCVFLFSVTGGGMNEAEGGLKELHIPSGAVIVFTGIRLMSVGAVMAAIIGILAAIFLFPLIAAVLAVISVWRLRKVSLKGLIPSMILVAVCFLAVQLVSLFTNGAGYYFHHDFGSKVYNEGYIIPHYEKLYGEKLELIEKQVNDPYSAAYTLRSGITGGTFTVKSENYETGSGSFDRLHLSADYGDILGSRLLTGEEISLPFEEGFSVKCSDSGHLWFYVRRSKGGVLVKFGSENVEDGQRAEGERYHIKLENNEMVFEIPMEGNRDSSYRFSINQKPD